MTWHLLNLKSQLLSHMNIIAFILNEGCITSLTVCPYSIVTHFKLQAL